MEELLKNLLFDAVMHRKPIVFDPERGEFTLVHSKFPATAKVRVPAIDDQLKGKPYTLFELYYFLLHYDKPVDRYVTKAREDRVRFVAFLHREKIFAGLFPGIRPATFTPAWLLDAPNSTPAAAAGAAAASEPPAKKPRRTVTEADLAAWRDHLDTYDGAVAGATEVTHHWTAKEGPPQIPPELKAVVEADRPTADIIDRLQKPVVSRLEGMQVAPGPRGDASRFFEDVLAIVRDVRTRSAVAASAGPAGSAAAFAPPSAGPLPPRRALDKDASNPKATPIHPVPPSLIPSSGRRAQRPIIIVPGAPSSLITLFNVKQFLEDGQWTDPSEAKVEYARAHPGASLRIDAVDVTSSKIVRPQELASLRAKCVDFRIVDDPQKLRAHEWDAVCACFVLGSLWQFRGWFSESPVEIFTKICGFHLTYAEDRPHPVSAHWSVAQLRVGRGPNARHGDHKVAKDFWLKLYAHLRRTGVFQESA